MKFTESHEWVEVSGDNAIVGITDYAQKELGEVVFVELPKVGYTVKAGDEVVVVESTKAAVDLYTPLSGKIIEVNAHLKEDPGLINQSAESKGWLFKLKLDRPQEVQALMDLTTYQNYIHPK